MMKMTMIVMVMMMMMLYSGVYACGRHDSSKQTITSPPLSSSSPVIPKIYPMFKQCDPSWGLDFMNGSGKYDTICAQGCAMSSLSMALNGHGYSLNNTTISNVDDGDDVNIQIDPKTLNAWLRANNGYVVIDGDPDNLQLPSVDKISSSIKFISEVEKPSEDIMRGYIDSSSPIMIAHVHNLSHFVLVTGYDQTLDSIFYVNDPYFNTTYYHYTDIADLLLYTM
eukprot:TRINITY_DN1962_c0_g2_i1.p1 TRINITY_DN1962_c0_g2~~TRINITY_DN1962_c0_g2_i1.p1  ORF type:complete len:224 (-),score=51.96 TRINITY_DN1962_c0_g2_i1:200-871(-)